MSPFDLDLVKFIIRHQVSAKRLLLKFTNRLREGGVAFDLRPAVLLSCLLQQFRHSRCP
jgi:hypothetical protein